MQTHQGPISPAVSTGSSNRNSSYFWSLTPSGKLVIFIHGYKGKAIATWARFDSLLLADRRFQDADCIFYGYDGLKTELIASSSLFLDFLHNICSNPADFINATLPPSVQRPTQFHYSSVLIVAHSLGAVITRQALVFACRQNFHWTSMVRMALFAPAHMGADVARLATEVAALNPIAALLSAFARFHSPLIDQLNPEKSTVLPALRQQVEAARGLGNPSLSPTRVFIATRENIVKNDPFPGDPVPHAIDGTHTSICKPDSANHKAFAGIGDLL